MTQASEHTSALQLFWVFLGLGLTAFGGPIAHLGYFRDAFVVRRQWFSEKRYADLVALCQFLPGPASSQVGLAIGYARCGYRGALAAWLGFTLPSAAIMIGLGLGLAVADWSQCGGVIQGLKLVALAVVAQAIWGMAHSLCPDRPRLSLMLITTVILLLFPGVWSQLAVIAVAGLLGWWGLKSLSGDPENDKESDAINDTVTSDSKIRKSSKVSKLAPVFIVTFALVLGVLPVILQFQAQSVLVLFDAFYRSGSLVFGGGHVVLPLLEAEVVQTGWVDKQSFLAGYGAAQALPGPLFTFAAFLGTVASIGPGGVWGGLLCLTAIFLPAFLLVLGVLPHWDRLRQHRKVQGMLHAVNAAVVGLLLAAFYQPLWESTVIQAQHFALALAAFGALMVWRVPPWLVVLVFAGGGWLLG